MTKTSPIVGNSTKIFLNALSVAFQLIPFVTKSLNANLKDPPRAAAEGGGGEAVGGQRAAVG